MSRIGKLPIELPHGVQVELRPGYARVKGPRGELERTLPSDITVREEGGKLVCERPSDGRDHRSLHGLTRALVANMVQGVTTGFERELILHGVGYRVSVDGRKLAMALGFSHPVDVPIPDGMEVEAQALGGNRHRILVRGNNKEAVGQFAANLRELRPVEPYNEKGFRYGTEVVRRKAGKAAVGGGAPGRK
jgi:large subunit ribosomal protein L6